MRTRVLVLFAVGFLFQACANLNAPPASAGPSPDEFYKTSKPCTRWWWFASEIDETEIESQLDWLRDKGFGGVEIAWIYPPGRDPDAARTAWLSEEWSRVVTHAKQYASSLGLACDFTFGSLWPFGGCFVSDSDRTKVFGDPDFRQKFRLSWEHPEIGNVIDHMDRGALERYARVMGTALRPAIAGAPSALFCDSWEVETRSIWTDGFGEAFEKRYGYDLRPFMDRIYEKECGDERYDYMTLVSEYVIDRFYSPFTAICHDLGAFARVQCSGSPTDLIRAYACVDVPESEAMLFEPPFSRIPASAAALSSRPLVSAETFTCVYGFPGEHLEEERTADLKLVADALFANGVNQIIWHGMPYHRSENDKNRFYATVHVGPQGALSRDLASFNGYMEKVAGFMRLGRTYSDVAVYLPLEDAWIAGEYPEEKQFPWAWGAYELRYVRMPADLAGYHPLWINRDFLEKGTLRGAALECGETRFTSLYVGVDHLDSDALDAILGLAEAGFPVCVARRPREPGRIKSGDFEARLDRLMSLDSVSERFEEIAVNRPLVALDGHAGGLPDFWCRVDGDRHYLFFAHPAAKELHLPLDYGAADHAQRTERTITITLPGASRKLTLDFKARQSLLVTIDADGTAGFVDIEYDPALMNRSTGDRQ